MSLTLEEVIRYLEGLPASELGALADEVLSRLGAPPIAPPARFIDRTMGVALRDPRDIGSPDRAVRLRHAGADKVAVIRVVRRVLGPASSLAEARRVVELAPSMIGEYLHPAEAEALCAELRGAGAAAEVIDQP